MTGTQSLIAIQTVLSASFGCIMYLRCGLVTSYQLPVTSHQLPATSFPVLTIDATLPPSPPSPPPSSSSLNHVPESCLFVRISPTPPGTCCPKTTFAMVRFVPRSLYLYLPLTTRFLARLVVGDSESGPGSTCSQTTDGGRVSNFKIMAVRRGFSSEGDLLLDYLEKGVFHALEKQYLKTFILALYLVGGPLLSMLHLHFCPGARLTVPIGQGGSE